jgi:DegV family protein with EDD domain
MTIHIISDTTAVLPAETAQRYNIPMMPQVIIFGAQSYFEGQEMDNAAFMQRLTTSRELPKTSAPPPELFVREFERLAPTGEPILCIHPSAELSGTIRAVTVAAERFHGADIRILDTRVVAGPLATMVLLAAEWREQGADADTIMARLREMIPRARIYFMVATLEYMARGGRIGGAAALLGGILQVKPILTVRDGKVDVLEKERTQKRAVARLKELVVQQIARDGKGYPSVMQASAPDEAQALADDLGARLGLRDIPIYDMPPAIVTHAGPGILGVGFFVEK